MKIIAILFLIIFILHAFAQDIQSENDKTPLIDSKSSEVTLPQLTEQQNQEKNQYLEQALKNYDEILENQEKIENSKLVKAAVSGSIKPIWPKPTDGEITSLSEEQKKERNNYLEEALKNYEELLVQQEFQEKNQEKQQQQANEDWKAKQRELMDQYYQEALKNYDIILQQQELKEIRNQQKDKNKKK